ncbi:hypothetical protein BDV38DRAFT_287728 [Aspergillus pseudotamarii]|uniref:Uncharacterized protein n=1 Tax=Aspergillus pseudotamarii TaxID=132259 RepID=A0A5N6SFF3_ASPPS|nr:uncharacterized protein BDV38DRAFT_287728 [Aspergillus pseudotamarii]KAE8132411.1 hypothetical protein BDV38DRAFT_287728 [Aspergillus pseudotamarii]
MYRTSLPPQPSTPEPVPAETEEIGSVSSMALSEPSSPNAIQEGNDPKQKGTTTGDSCILPLRKQMSSETSPTANLTDEPHIVPSQIAADKPRPPENPAAELAPSRRNAIVPLTPLPLFKSVKNKNEEIYNGVAYWYQSFRLQMWSPVASMVGIHWEKAEQLSWHMGREEIFQRSTSSMAIRPIFYGKGL